MKQPTTSTPVQVGTYREFSYKELKSNPQNPRRLFDQVPLKVLEDSIRANGILVPLTIYLEKRNNQHYILDGERRWRCAEAIETDTSNPRKVRIPANVVEPPTPVANILWMFNIHNLREQWDLMPTALSLEVVMKELGQADDRKLAELTKLSEPQIKRCKMLLTYDKQYQERMMAVDTDKRIKANFFIELYPVLDLYMKMPKPVRGGKTLNQLIDHFLNMYEAGKIASVIHFRRILEAYDYIREAGEVDEAKEARFQECVQKLATSTQYTIRKLFDPLTAEDKSIDTAQRACADFLDQMKRLKIEHVVKRTQLRKSLQTIQEYVSNLLTKLEG